MATAQLGLIWCRRVLYGFLKILSFMMESCQDAEVGWHESNKSEVNFFFIREVLISTLDDLVLQDSLFVWVHFTGICGLIQVWRLQAAEIKLAMLCKDKFCWVFNGRTSLSGFWKLWWAFVFFISMCFGSTCSDSGVWPKPQLDDGSRGLQTVRRLVCEEHSAEMHAGFRDIIEDCRQIDKIGV